MSKRSPFAQQSCEQIARATFNTSTSKNLWTFSKQKRFTSHKPVCPFVSYQQNLSTLQQPKMAFGSAHRSVFTQSTQGPCSWVYNPTIDHKRNGVLIADGRQKCLANTYIPLQQAKNPAPNRYNRPSLSKKVSYSMRPKTANQRTYFIDNQQTKMTPSPFQYQQSGQTDGIGHLSKFKTALLGSCSIQNKNKRFKTSYDNTPGPPAYRPIKFGINRMSRGGKMGNDHRRSFIDDVSSSDFTPGPGKYQAPSDFGHYRKNRASVL